MTAGSPASRLSGKPLLYFRGGDWSENERMAFRSWVR